MRTTTYSAHRTRRRRCSSSRSHKAGGSGLNLTAASHVIHFDRWWNPAVESQATDRAFRIGGPNSLVFVTALLAALATPMLGWAKGKHANHSTASRQTATPIVMSLPPIRIPRPNRAPLESAGEAASTAQGRPNDAADGADGILEGRPHSDDPASSAALANRDIQGPQEALCATQPALPARGDSGPAAAPCMRNRLGQIAFRRRQEIIGRTGPTKSGQ